MHVYARMIRFRRTVGFSSLADLNESLCNAMETPGTRKVASNTESSCRSDERDRVHTREKLSADSSFRQPLILNLDRRDSLTPHAPNHFLERDACGPRKRCGILVFRGNTARAIRKVNDLHAHRAPRRRHGRLRTCKHRALTLPTPNTDRSGLGEDDALEALCVIGRGNNL